MCLVSLRQMSRKRTRMVPPLLNKESTSKKGDHDPVKIYKISYSTPKRNGMIDAVSSKGSPSPNLLIESHSELYEPEVEQRLERKWARNAFYTTKQNLAIPDFNGEVEQIFRKRRKKRGNNWSRPKGETRSRLRARAYNNDFTFDNIPQRGCHSYNQKYSRSYSSLSLRSAKSAKSTRSCGPVMDTTFNDFEDDFLLDNYASDEDTFICTQCSYDMNPLYRSIDEFTEHKVSAHGAETPYDCRQCRKEYITMEHLRGHMELTHLSYQIDCFMCGESIPGISKLQEHLRLHMKVSFPCNYCDKFFTDIEGLYIHLKIHREKKNVKSRPSPKQDFIQIFKNNGVKKDLKKSVVRNVEKSFVTKDLCQDKSGENDFDASDRFSANATPSSLLTNGPYVTELCGNDTKSSTNGSVKCKIIQDVILQPRSWTLKEVVESSVMVNSENSKDGEMAILENGLEYIENDPLITNISASLFEAKVNQVVTQAKKGRKKRIDFETPNMGKRIPIVHLIRENLSRLRDQFIVNSK